MYVCHESQQVERSGYPSCFEGPLEQWTTAVVSLVIATRERTEKRSHQLRNRIRITDLVQDQMKMIRHQSESDHFDFAVTRASLESIAEQIQELTSIGLAGKDTTTKQRASVHVVGRIGSVVLDAISRRHYRYND